MLRKPVAVAFTMLALVAAACSSAQSSTTGDATGAPPGEPGASSTPPGDPDDPANQPPHALGTIVLGEAHAAGQSKSAPVVSVGFVPDAAKVAACGKQTIAGCTIVTAPKCAKACAVGEACTWDTSCAAACTKIPQCTTQCEKDETCKLSDPKTGDGTCTKTESFDAGPVAFGGTTTPITLYPPYAFEGDAQGAPFLPGASLRVTAQGATGAGFMPFDETFTATTFLQTTPSLDKLTLESVFGDGPLSIAWAPGHDSVVVTVTGAGGSATCKADDATGKLDVPRAAIDAVRGDANDFGSGNIALSVARQRKETKKDGKTRGSLASTPIQPVGWIDLVTSSTETTSFSGCSAGSRACGNACIDVQSDPKNCGACGKSCGSGTQCVKGACVAGCAAGPENTPAACSDGCSNDGDAYIDCDDFDCCPVRSDCPPTSSCGKGL